MPKYNQKGIAHILILLVLLVAGIGLGIYLIQNRTNIFPRAASGPIGPETSFTLESNKQSVKVGETFTVDVIARSDFDYANTFSALVSYPSDKLEVVGIEPPSGGASPSAVLSSGISSSSEKDNLLSRILNQISSKVEAQGAIPTLSGFSVCIVNTPRVALFWNSDLRPDVLNWDIHRVPDFVGFPGAFVGNYTYPFASPKIGRIDAPLLAQGDAGGTYTYYLQDGSTLSNKVTVTNNAVCSNNSFFVGGVVPFQVKLGEQFNVKYTFQNTGTRVWPSQQFSFLNEPKVELKLISNTPFTPNSNEVKKIVAGNYLGIYPYQIYTFEFPVTAPTAGGTYDFNWQLSYGGANFGAISTNQVRVVSPPTPSVTPTPKPSITPSITPKPSVSSTPTPPQIFFIKKWIEQSDDKQGKLTLVGAVPNPGFKTVNGEKGLMAKITFRAKANGQANLDFIKDGTAIYRNSDNQNILGTLRGVAVNIGTGGPSSFPSPVTTNTPTSTSIPLPSIVPPSASSTPLPPSIDGRRADLFKDAKKPNFINDQDISVFFTKCAEKGVELFGQAASVQPICDILQDGKITVQDWSVFIKFRNQSV